MSRLRRGAVLLLVAIVVLAALPRPSRAQAPDAGALDQRMRAFLRAVEQRDADSIAAFFPRAGAWTYRHTAHGGEGDRVGTWRFRGGETARAIRGGGPLWPSFNIQYEGQPIGLFAHQVMLREGAWRRVRGNRFVPPGASASSAIFVEWRRESGGWVISSLGDERFAGRRVPDWCC